MTSCHVSTLEHSEITPSQRAVPDKRSNCIMMIYDVRTYEEREREGADGQGERSTPVRLTGIAVGDDNHLILTCEPGIIANTDCVQAAPSSNSRNISSVVRVSETASQLDNATTS